MSDGFRSVGEAVDHQGVANALHQVRVVVGGRTVDAEADRAAGGLELAGAALAGACPARMPDDGPITSVPHPPEASMFAPYCPTCQTRILLGISRIVAGIGDDGSVESPILACWCGTHVAW